MDDKRWKGLFQKEWILMKWGVLAYVLLSAFIVFAGPRLISSLFEMEYDFFDHTLPLVGAWLAFGTAIGYGMLIPSLGKEMKQPEVWLHSPAPMLQLVGAKAVFVGMMTACLLCLTGVFLVISFLFSEAFGKVDMASGLLALLSAIIAIFLNSAFVMAVGFFFWAVYHAIRSYIGEVSYIVTFALFVGTALGWEKLRVFGLFKAIGSFVPIKATSTTFYNESDSYYFTGIVPEGVITSIGSLLFYGTLTVILFVVGAKLFEKKVRL